MQSMHVETLARIWSLISFLNIQLTKASKIYCSKKEMKEESMGISLAQNLHEQRIDW